MGFRFKGGKVKKEDAARREFLTTLVKGAVSSFFLFFIGRSFAGQVIPFSGIKRKIPVIPPGGISVSNFTALCTACHLCVSVCPSHVIKPSLLQYGPAGIFQPVMDYDSSFCNYECCECLKVCPTGAMKEYPLESKKLIQIGQANLIRENCIVYARSEHCGICAEYCPTGAVYLVPYEKGLPAPVTDGEICIGCGACEFACPARPEKAIYIEGNPVHGKAKRKEEKHPEKKNAEEKDFPF
jgi:ferredoxin